MTTSTLTTNIKDHLERSCILLGLNEASRKSVEPSRPNQENRLIGLLRTRLQAYRNELGQHDDDGRKDIDHDDENDEEEELKISTAEACLECLMSLSRLLPSSTTITTNTTKKDEKGKQRDDGQRIPLLSIQQTRVVGQLSSIVARWGIALNAQDGLLPTALTGHRSTNKKQKIVEISDQHERIRRKRFDRLKKFVDRLVQVLEMTKGEKQVRDLILPQVLLPLIRALLQLSTFQSHHDQEYSQQVYFTELDKLVNSRTPITIIPHLLTLLSSSSTSSHKRVLSSLLSKQVLRSGGVRSLLLVVVGTGERGELMVDTTKLDGIVRLLLARPQNGGDQEHYFHSIFDQLTEILESSIQSSLSADSKSLPASSPPSTILQATIYVLSHYFLQPPLASIRDRFEIYLYTNFFPTPPSQNNNTSTTEYESKIVISSEKLLCSLTRLSIILLYLPPLPNLIQTLLSPLLPFLFVLKTFLNRNRKKKIVQFDRRFGEEVEGLLKFWGTSFDIMRGSSESKEGMDSTLTSTTNSTSASTLAPTSGLTSTLKNEANDGIKELSRVVETIEDGKAFSSNKSYLYGTTDRDSKRFRFGIDLESNGIAVFFDSEREWSGFEGVERRGGDDGTELGGEEGEVDVESLIEWLKEIENDEFSSRVLIRFLDELMVLRRVDRADAARKSLTRLSLVLKMIDEMGSEILLARPDKIIAFVAHALEEEDSSSEDRSTTQDRDALSRNGAAKMNVSGSKSGISLADLKIVDDESISAIEDCQEDEEEEPIIPGIGQDEMTLTSLTLLLAVLEANEEITISNNALLSIIFGKLDRIAERSKSEFVPNLAREAKLVLSAREALNASSPSSSSNGFGPSSTVGAKDAYVESRKTYQTALRYLQDPLLPVRAQGLTLLRSLVHSKNSFLSTDPALLPAVLDIFIQSLSEEDSFLYLNAIQGLSSLVDVHGKTIVQRLMVVYRGGSSTEIRPIGKGEKARSELDKRLRIAEALTKMIERAAKSYVVFANDLVPTLLIVLKDRDLPTSLRSSSLTVLANCVEIGLQGMRPWIVELSEACLTLLSIESRPLQAKKSGPIIDESNSSEGPEEDSEEEEGEEFKNPFASLVSKQAKRPEETPDPTTIDPQHPSFRRSAILFIGLLLRSIRYAQQEEQQERNDHYDESNPFGQGGMRLPSLGNRTPLIRESKTTSASSFQQWGVDVQRVKVVLGYVRETDQDGLVRHQAGEVLDEL